MTKMIANAASSNRAVSIARDYRESDSRAAYSDTVSVPCMLW